MSDEQKLKILKTIDKYRTVILYVVFAIAIELLAVRCVDNTMIVSEPWLGFSMLALTTGILLVINNNKVRLILGLIFMVAQFILDLAMTVVYDMAGQYFDYAMLSLRNDAFGILEEIYVDYVFFYASVAMVIIFIVAGIRKYKQDKGDKAYGRNKTIGVAFIILSIFSVVIVTYINNNGSDDKYTKLRTSHARSVYSSYGITGNLVNEFVRGVFYDDIDPIPDNEIQNYLYQDIAPESPYFGVSSGNNVIVILAESWEWFGIMNDEEFINGLGLTDEQYAELYPNIMRLLDSSVVMTDYHAKEKTDISECLSIVGSYPTVGFINYDYKDNIMPYAMPNVLRIFDEDIVCRSFHNGTAQFYNRNNTHGSFGIDHFYASEEMYDMTAPDGSTMENHIIQGERNLDSEMINVCQDLMFPTDSRFYTYITTITMHGMYYERNNLADYRERILEVYTPTGENENEDIIIDYMSTIMEFDKALGMLMDDLEERGLLDNTTIAIFADHNAYYQSLGAKVKGIEDYDTDQDYSDLYRVPFLIYDQNLPHMEIDKFTCQADIVPTLLDLLGIHYYSNMYYGHSVFTPEESVIYSRAYNFFIDDGIVAGSLVNPFFRDESVTDEDWNNFVYRGGLMIDKLRIWDQIYLHDYFDNESNYSYYLQRMMDINE